MGFHDRIASVASPARMRASTPGPTNNWWYQTPEGWTLPLEAAGVNVTPELALTLSYVHCAVATITDDFGTSSCQGFRDLGEDGRARVKYTDAGIGALAYRLRWQPNSWQTAKAFWSTLCWQYLLRPAAYAEIIYRPGSDGFVESIVPRHPDRVRQEVLPSGRIRFVLTEPGGAQRIVTQEEMFVVRNTSTDGLNAVSRTRFGAKAIATGLALQDFTKNYFQKGATAAIVGSYKDDLDEDEEKQLHSSISRYMSGVENAGGFLLVPGDITLSALGVDPNKAQLLGLKELSGRDIARLFKIPPHKLFISQTQNYGSQVQSAQEYVSGCQMPIAVEFEQAMQRDLVVRKDLFFFKFNMDYLLRADFKTRMEGYEIGIRARVLRPSEARVREDLPPDSELDQLSASDYRPGSSDGQRTKGNTQARLAGAAQTARADFRKVLFVHDAAQRCVARERIAVEKLAKKHPSDVGTWQAELKVFYADHARFVADTMRLPDDMARAYAAQHGSVIESKGVVAMSDAWAKVESEELVALSLEGEAAAA